ncbi:MAG: DNA polymerase I [Planctomycetota bacterium]|nr:MAG: DNA polymerase I [Planctomycetota bacterium]
MTDQKRNRLLLVDGTALAFRAFFAIPGLSDGQGRPSGALFGFLNGLLRALEEHHPSHLAVAWDRPEPTFRHQLSEAYKATRERMDQDLLVQLPWMREAVELLGLQNHERPGYEADDILASWAQQGEVAGFEVILLAGDKDFAQVVSDRVCLSPPPKRGEASPRLGPQEVEEKFGVPPAQMVDWQALVGDSSDNVPGVPGVGPKRATALLKKYGDLESVLTRGAQEEKGKLRENLEQHAETARQAQKLVRLVTDLDLGDLGHQELGQADWQGLIDFCDQHSFQTLGERFRKEQEQQGESPEEPDQNRDYRLVDTAEKFAELLQGLQQSGGFVVDTETTSVDPMRAQLVGVSFAWQDHQAWYVPMNLDPPLQGPNGESPLAALAPLLADPDLPKAGQNLKYDAHVLARAGAPVRGWTFDTMVAHFLADPLSPHNLDSLALRFLGERKIPTSDLLGKGRQQITMAEVPIEEVSVYACEDADVTRRLMEPMRRGLQEAEAETLFEQMEMPLVSVLQKMEARGVRVDAEHLARLNRQLQKQQADLEDQVHQLAGRPFNLNSPKQLGPILFESLRIQDQAGVKKVGRTKTGYRTDAGTMERYRGIEIVDALLEYRQVTKLRGTYVEALPQYIHPQTGCIHTSYHQAVASTGRLSSSDPNLQNIPIRTDAGREIRRAFVPLHPDWIMVSADYSQIELRVVAHLAGDPALAEAFVKGLDVHASTAALIFGVDLDQVSAEMRARAKTINFGILYGMGPARLSRELDLSFAEAKQFIEVYFEALPGVRNWLDRTLEEARESGVVRTLLGRQRPVPELQSADGRVRASAENVAVNTPVQGTAADLIKMAMIRLDRRLEKEGLQARMLLQVHDELVFDCPPEELESLSQLAKQEMEQVHPLDVPLKVDVGHGSDWASAH